MTTYEALVALNRAGKLIFTHEETAEYFQAVWGGREIDLTSPVDTGCLAAIARHASGRERLSCVYDRRTSSWDVHDPLDADYDSGTYEVDGEGEAWAIALIGMAQALP